MNVGMNEGRKEGKTDQRRTKQEGNTMFTAKYNYAKVTTEIRKRMANGNMELKG